jgi:hypothetical protein
MERLRFARLDGGQWCELGLLSRRALEGRYQPYLPQRLLCLALALPKAWLM